MGFCSRGERLGLTQYNKEKWEFIAMKYSGGEWMENYQEETSREKAESS